MNKCVRKKEFGRSNLSAREISRDGVVLLGVAVTNRRLEGKTNELSSKYG